MRVVCPYCETTYQIEGVDEETILVCHLCGAEFDANQQPEDIQGSAETSSDEETPLLPPPPRTTPHIMPWLLSILLIVTATGIWVRHDAWLDNPWLRSVLINIGLPIEVRDKDWHIQSESVHAQWVKRDDGSQVLVIEGRVKNLLQCELHLPAIHINIFANNNPKHLLLQRELPISQPPLMVTIHSTPYIAPPEDHLPVTALGDRGFTLVLKGLPKNAGDFTLSPIARGGV